MALRKRTTLACEPWIWAGITRSLRVTCAGVGFEPGAGLGAAAGFVDLAPGLLASNMVTRTLFVWAICWMESITLEISASLGSNSRAVVKLLMTRRNS